MGLGGGIKYDGVGKTNVSCYYVCMCVRVRTGKKVFICLLIHSFSPYYLRARHQARQWEQKR